MLSMPRIDRLGNGSVELTFPYNPGLICRIKNEIPGSARTYNPATKIWTVAEPYAALASGLMRRTFGDVQTRDEPAGQPPFTVIRGGVGDPDLMILYLRDDAPPELIEAAYRCLARLHHPDRGGDTTRMQRINAAIGRLRDRQGVAS